MSKEDELQLHIRLKAHLAEATKIASNIDKIEGETAKLERRAKSTNKVFDNLAKGIQMGVGLSGGMMVTQAGMKLTQFMKLGVQTGMKWNSQIEQTEIALTNLLKSEDAAAERMDDILDFDAKTPFQFPQLIQMNRLLQQMSQGALATYEGMTLVGDVAATLDKPQEKLQSVAMWIGRVYGGLKSGTPIGEATLRLIEMGAISGEDKLKLDALAGSAHSVSEVMAILGETFKDANGAMEMQSRSFDGLSSTFATVWGMFQKAATGGFFNELRDTMEFLLISMGEIDSVTESFLKRLMLVPEEAAKAARAIQMGGGDMTEFQESTMADYERKKEERAFIEKTLAQLRKEQEENRYNGSQAGKGLMVGTESAREASQRVALIRRINEELGTAIAENDRALISTLEKLWLNYGTVLGGVAREVRLSKEEFNLPDDYDALGVRKYELSQKDRNETATPRDLRELELVSEKLNNMRSLTEDLLSRSAEIKRNHEMAVDPLKFQVEEISKKIALLDVEAAMTAQSINDEEARALFWKETETKRLALLNEQKEALEEIDKQEKEANAHRLESLREVLEAEEQILKTKLRNVESGLSKLNGNWRIADAVKYGAEKKLYHQAIADLDEIIKAKQFELEAMTPGAEKELVRGQLDDYQDKRQGYEQKRDGMGPDPLSFTQNIEAGFVDLANTWGSVQEVIGQGLSGTLSTAVDTLSSSLAEAITTTGDFGDIWKDVGVAILNQLIQIATQMLVIKGLSMLGLPGFGGGVGFLGLKLFASGGRLGKGYGIAEPDEFVVRPAATQFLDQALGPGWLDSVNRDLRLPSMPGQDFTSAKSFASSLDTVGEGGSAPKINFAMVNDTPTAEDFLSSESGRGMIVNIMKQNFWEVSNG